MFKNWRNKKNKLLLHPEVKVIFAVEFFCVLFKML